MSDEDIDIKNLPGTPSEYYALHLTQINKHK